MLLMNLCSRPRLFTIWSPHLIGKCKHGYKISSNINPFLSRPICSNPPEVEFIYAKHFCLLHSRTFDVQNICGRIVTCTRSYSKANFSEQKKKPSTSSNLYIPILFGVYAFLALTLYSIDKLKKTTKKRELLEDPLMKGNDAAAFKHHGFWLPVTLVGGKSTMQKIKEFDVNKSDIYVVSFPKSGTTWVQEIVYQILHEKSTESNKTIDERFPYLEFIYPGLRELSKRSSPRLIKSHLPYSLLPEDIQGGKGKVIYIARNPKDVSVSYYHFVKMLSIASYQGNFNQFFTSFISGNVNYGPWEDHVAECWKFRDQNNILFITYEDLQQDLPGAINKIAGFLGRELSVQRTKEICRQCSFHAMKNNDACNYSWWDDAGIRNKSQTTFMRKGQVGDWRHYYSEDMRTSMDKLCVEKLAPLGLTFKDRL